jgi:hypothetical protein
MYFGRDNKTIPDHMKRMGKFKVSRELIIEQPEMVSLIMQNCIILRAEDRLWEGLVTYWAISPLFEEASEGEQIPTYMWTFHCKEGEEPSVTAELWRMNDG